MLAIILETVPSISQHPVARHDCSFFASLRRLPQTRVCLRIAALALLLAGLPAQAQQQEGNVILEPSEQVFCVMAALNAGGYDTGLGLPTGDNTREEARK